MLRRSTTGLHDARRGRARRRSAQAQFGPALGICLAALGPASCAPHLAIDGAQPAPEALRPLRCVVVLPFDNETTDPSAGDMVAAIASSSLVLRGAFDIIEPTAARRLAALHRETARGPKVAAAAPDAAPPNAAKGASASSTLPAALRGLAEFDIDAALVGKVIAFTPSPADGASSLAVAVELRDTREGKLIWRGEARSDDERLTARATLSGLTVRAMDELFDAFEVEPGATRRSACSELVAALPRAPVLEAKAVTPAPTQRASTPAAVAQYGSPSATLAAAPTGAIVTPSTAAPLAPLGSPTGTLAAAPTSFAGPGTDSAPSGAPASDLPLAMEPPPSAGTADAQASDRSRPGTGEPTLPPEPLPDLPQAGQAVAAGAGSATPAAGTEEPALPGIPEIAGGDVPALPEVGADAYAGLPYSPAAPEPPPVLKGKPKPRHKQLVKQLYLGTAVIRRLFKPGAPKMLGAAKRALADVAAVLRAVKDLKLEFEVHADVGNPARSQALADKQLAQLQRFVEKSMPFAKGRLFFRSLGARQPLAKDVSARGRVQNSRVEVLRVY